MVRVGPPIGGCIRGVLVAAVLLALGGASAADAALPVYQSPGFKGSRTAPPTKPAPSPTTVPLSEAGTFPNMVLDEAGTAHVVWNEGRGDGLDTVVYCRLKRGATTCDRRAELAPVKEYGAGDGPEFNIDNDGPKIVRIGSQLVILTYRYPTVFDRPDGAGSGAVVEWTSNDGGTSWTGGQVTARHDINGGAVGFGPDDAPRLLTINHTGPCGVCVQQIRPGAYDPSAGNLGAGIPDAAYNGSITLQDGLPAAAFSDLSRVSYVRRWGGAEPITDPATWTAPVPVNGDEPVLSGGRAGLWIANRPVFGGPFVVRRVQGTAVSAPVTLSRGKEDAFAALAQDEEGGLYAAWESRSTEVGNTPGYYLRRGAGGALGRERLLIPGPAAGQPALAAAVDGGGFLVANQTGGINSEGRIVAAPFGTGASTNRPGLGGLPGGSAPDVSQTCQRISFGAVKVSTDFGCFLHGAGQFSNVSVTEDDVDLNGLRIVPDPGAKIVIDPAEKKLYTTGGARVLLEQGDLSITLWHGVVRLDLPSAGPGQLLASFDTSQFGVDVAGFGVSGKIDVYLTSEGVRIPISLRLPPYFGDIRGDAVLIGRSGSGLVLDSLQIHAANIFLGPLLLETFDLKYTRTGEVWDGSARMRFPPGGAGGALDGHVVFEGGAFKSGSAGYEPPAPGIVVAPLLYLTRLEATFELDPTHIGIGGRLGAGAAVNGVSPVSLDGRIDMFFPKGGPFRLTGTGSVSLLMLKLGNARWDFVSDGYLAFHGDVSLPPMPVISIGGSADGFVDGVTRRFGAKAEVHMCVDLSVGPAKFPCVTADFAANPEGVAVCGSAELPDPTAFPPFSDTTTISGGLEMTWASINPVVLANPTLLAATVAKAVRVPCHTSKYVEQPRALARAAQAGTASVTLPAGLPSATIALIGAGGSPDVDVAGPNGAKLARGSMVLRSAEAGATYVVLRTPAAGTWTVTAKPGSPPIAQVLRSSGYTPARVRAGLSGRGRARALHYSITDGTGQTVRFGERGAFGTRFIGAASGRSGTVRWSTGDPRPGRRNVFAVIEHDGLATDEVALGSYVAPPPPAPGRPRGGVRVRRVRSRAIITWGPGANAARYLVAVRGSHGLRRQVIARTRRVVVSRLAPGERVTASVRAMSRTGRRGPIALSRR